MYIRGMEVHALPGAEVLATACPYCLNMLTDACKSLDKQDDLEITELSELLAAALP